ncbi:MAG: radical SAM protein, partial [Xanthobacteraceae bacterium]
GMRIVSPVAFYPWRALDFLKTTSQWLRLVWRYRRIMTRVVADPAASAYTDEALQLHTGTGATDHFVEVFADKIPHTHGAPARAPTAVAAG